jgi:hypothetical protein
VAIVRAGYFDPDDKSKGGLHKFLRLGTFMEEFRKMRPSCRISFRSMMMAVWSTLEKRLAHGEQAALGRAPKAVALGELVEA